MLTPTPRMNPDPTVIAGYFKQVIQPRRGFRPVIRRRAEGAGAGRVDVPPVQVIEEVCPLLMDVAVQHQPKVRSPQLLHEPVFPYFVIAGYRVVTNTHPQHRRALAHLILDLVVIRSSHSRKSKITYFSSSARTSYSPDASRRRQSSFDPVSIPSTFRAAPFGS